MPRKIFTVTDFSKGLISDADPKDLPKEAASTLSNFKVTSPGKLSLVDAYEKDVRLDTVGTWNPIANSTIVPRMDGTYYYIGVETGNYLRLTKDFGVSTATTSSTSLSEAYDLMGTPYGATIGTGWKDNSSDTDFRPYFAGYGVGEQFSSDISASAINEYWGITRPYYKGTIPQSSTYGNPPYFEMTLTSKDYDTGTCGYPPAWYQFDKDTTYEYAITFLYDDYQESPLSYNNDSGGTTTHCQWTPPDVCYDVKIELNVYIDYLSKRVKKIRIYRVNWGASVSKGLYRLVKEIDINDSGWVDNTTYQTFSWEDHEDYGVSYEANSNIPEAIHTVSPGYKTIDRVLDYYFVGNCAVKLIGYDNSNWGNAFEDYGASILLRSQPGHPERYNWTQDILRLKHDINVVKGFKTKLLAFGDNKITLVNASGFYVEREFNLKGIKYKSQVAETPEGLWFANTEGLFFFNGTEIANVTRMLIESKWHTKFTTNYLKVYYNYAENELQIYELNDSDAIFYNLSFKSFSTGSVYRYDAVQSLEMEVHDVITGLDGNIELLAVDSGYTTETLFAVSDSTDQSYSLYYSPMFTFGNITQPKKIYNIKIENSGKTFATNSALKYRTSSDASWTTFTNGEFLNITGNALQIYVSGVDELRSIEVIYRPLMGARL